MTARAELSSMATSLDELVNRVGKIVEGLSKDEQETLGPDLFELERTLQQSRRGLTRLLDSLR